VHGILVQLPLPAQVDAKLALFLHKPLCIEAMDEGPRGYWTVVPERRRSLIAALGRAVFVIETRPRGGTLHTVRAAEQLEPCADTTLAWQSRSFEAPWRRLPKETVAQAKAFLKERKEPKWSDDSKTPEMIRLRLLSGSRDLSIIVRVKENDQLSDLVTNHLRKLEGIERTTTLIGFRAYSNYDLDRMCSIGFE